MKKLLITLLTVITVSVSANAQLYLGGNAGLSVGAASGNTNVSFLIAPEIGYDFNESIAAGVALSFSNPSAFYASPYFRYYFTKAGNCRFLLDAIFDVGSASSAFSWGAGINPGLAVSLNDHWGIVTHLGRIGVQGIQGSTAFEFRVLGGAGVGFYYHF